MKYSNCFARAGTGQQGLFKAEPQNAVSHIVRLDDSVYPGAMTLEAMWLKASCEDVGLRKYASGTMWVFVGSDMDDHENLNAEIELQIENDVLTITETCVVFVPEGAAFGNFKVKNVKKPVLSFYLRTGADTYETATATAPQGKYINNAVYKYLPPSGEIPDAPEGFIEFLLYLDTVRLPGAPYLETVWFKTENDTGPSPHVHDFPEFIAFIGTDPENPEELGAEIRFYMGDEREYEATAKSTLIFVPAGVRHGPLTVPQMSRPVIHFSGNNGEAYVRDNLEGAGNQFKVD